MHPVCAEPCRAEADSAGIDALPAGRNSRNMLHSRLIRCFIDVVDHQRVGLQMSAEHRHDRPLLRREHHGLGAQGELGEPRRLVHRHPPQLNRRRVDHAVDRAAPERQQRRGEIFIDEFRTGIALFESRKRPRDDADEQCVLVGVARVERALGDACGRRDRLHRGAVIAVLEEDGDRGLAQPLLQLLGLGVRWPPAACWRAHVGWKYTVQYTLRDRFAVDANCQSRQFALPLCKAGSRRRSPEPG